MDVGCQTCPTLPFVTICKKSRKPPNVSSLIVLWMVGVVGWLLFRYGRRLWNYIRENRFSFFEPQKLYDDWPSHFVDWKKRWQEREARAAEHAKLQARNLGQINGQLYSCCDWEGNPLPEKGSHRMYHIELVGHRVQIYDDTQMCRTGLVHPQDTILDLMQKFKIPCTKLLMYKCQPLTNLDSTLMEYGIPDNHTIALGTVPRTSSALKD